jgi:hypothetical protein
MLVTLNQDEIEAAIVHFVNSHAVNTTDKTISIGLVAGRKGNGFSANVSISNDKTPAAVHVLSEAIDEDTSEAVIVDDEEELETTNIFGAA